MKRLLKLKKKKKKIIYCLSTTLLNIKTQVICVKNYARQKVKNEDQVYLIKEVLNNKKKMCLKIKNP